MVRRGGPGETLVRITSVGVAGRVSVRLPRMEYVFCGIYVHHARAHSVDDLPAGLYRLASASEIAAARENGALPPELDSDRAPFA